MPKLLIFALLIGVLLSLLAIYLTYPHDPEYRRFYGAQVEFFKQKMVENLATLSLLIVFNNTITIHIHITTAVLGGFERK